MCDECVLIPSPNSEAAALYPGSDLELKFMVSTENSVLALFFSVEVGGFRGTL